MTTIFARVARYLARPKAPAVGLTHEEAVQYLVEFHFGRLPRELNDAVAAHVRACARCQREGLRHAATEQHVTARRLGQVRASRPRHGRARWRIMLLVAALIAALVIAGVGQSRGWLAEPHGHVSGTRGGVPATTAAETGPAHLQPIRVIAGGSDEVSAVALSPSGAMLAIAYAADGTPAVVVRTTSTSTVVQQLSWPGGALPGALTWSPDGTQVAGTNGSRVVIWSIKQAGPSVVATVPGGAHLRVLRAADGSVVTQSAVDDAAFAGGAVLQWGADGSVTSVSPAAAGPSGVLVVDGPLVGLWRVAGTDLYPTSDQHVSAGTGPDSATAPGYLLTWSPDGRFLLEGQADVPVALAQAHTASTSGSMPPPDAVIASLAQSLAQAGYGDVLVWFAPDGQLVATCQRSAADVPLRIIAVATGAVVSQVPHACAGMALGALSWSWQSTSLALAVPMRPVTIYRVAAAVRSRSSS